MEFKFVSGHKSAADEEVDLEDVETTPWNPGSLIRK